MSTAIKQTREFKFDYLLSDWNTDLDGNATDASIPLEITCHYEPSEHGSRGDYGEPMEPDEPPRIEILSIFVKGTNAEYKVTPSVEDKILSKAWEELGGI